MSDTEKSKIFESYCDLIRTFIPGMSVKITINNRKVNIGDVRDKISIPYVDDELAGFRAEYNQMLAQAVTDRNNLTQEKYITISSEFKSYEEAQRAFDTVGKEFSIRLNAIKSSCTALTPVDRLKILHDFYRDGEEAFGHDFEMDALLGTSFADYICPDYMDLTDPSYIRLSEKKLARVLFIKDYGKQITDDFVSKLTQLDKEMMYSIDCFVIPSDEAVREANNKLMGVETNVTRWQSRQNKSWNFSATVPIEYTQQQKGARDLLTDITEYDQQMLLAVTTIVLTASTEEELDLLTEEMRSRAAKYLVQIATLRWEQLDGINTVLPIGVCRQNKYRTLITESVGIFMPFRVQDVLHDNGIYYGQNIESGSLILVSKPTLQNGNAFVFGIPGSGKSFIVKMEIIGHVLRGDCDVIIVDPQGEYGKLIKPLGGEVIQFSPSSPTAVNLMDINEEYREEGGTPVALKSDFMISFVLQACEGMIVTPVHRSIIIRCTELVYEEYVASGYTGRVPTLSDFLEVLKVQPEPEGQELALALEMFTSQSFSMFSKETNVDTNSSLLCYDIKGLGTTLQSVGMLTMLDAIFNRITLNRKRGRNTYVFFDEFHLLTKDTYSVNYLDKLWRTIRKFGAFATGITQNIEQILQNDTVRSLVSNSEVITMLNQAEQDRRALANLLKISPALMKYVTNAPEGHGLMRISETIVPFANNFPKNTELYDLMNTKFSELQQKYSENNDV